MSPNPQLQLRWRNPRPPASPEQWSERTRHWHLEDGSINPFTLRTIEDVIEAYDLTIPKVQRDNWRYVFPNVGYLRSFPEYPTAVPLATNGLLAYFWVDHSGKLFLGHLANFVGPLAKEYVYEDDWDWEKNKRRVRVFKRKDGSIVIIPQDTFWEHYWSTHKQLTKEHHDILCQVGRSIHACDIDTEFAKLDGLKPTPNYKPKVKTKRQMIIDSI